MNPVLAVLFRFLHIGSAVVIIGGALFGPKTESQRRWISAAAIVSLLSGLYNLFTKTNVPAGYHMWFGIKMLFALHVLAVAILISRGSMPLEKKERLERGLRWTGIAILGLSAYLRYLSTWMLV
jgi:hypothetical protein